VPIADSLDKAGTHRWQFRGEPFLRNQEAVAQQSIQIREEGERWAAQRVAIWKADPQWSLSVLHWDPNRWRCFTHGVHAFLPIRMTP
jgi:hypothetical protein